MTIAGKLIVKKTLTEDEEELVLLLLGWCAYIRLNVYTLFSICTTLLFVLYCVHLYHGTIIRTIIVGIIVPWHYANFHEFRIRNEQHVSRSRLLLYFKRASFHKIATKWTHRSWKKSFIESFKSNFIVFLGKVTCFQGLQLSWAKLPIHCRIHSKWKLSCVSF